VNALVGECAYAVVENEASDDHCGCQQ